MRCTAIIFFVTILVFLCSFCVTGILHNGSGLKKSKEINKSPLIKIKIVEKDKFFPKVSAKIYGKGKPIPKIMARIYNGPKTRQLIQRKYLNKKISKHPVYYRKYSPLNNFNSSIKNLHLSNTQPVSAALRGNKSHFRSPSSNNGQLYYTSTNELESNYLGDNSISQQIYPKGYLPVNNNNPQNDYLKLLGDINYNENYFPGGYQSNFPKLNQYSPHPLPVHMFNEESIPLHFSPQNIPSEKIHPNLSEEAKRYIEFMASGEYFLPKILPDYRKISNTQNSYISQPKYVEQNSQQRYIPLSQDRMTELSRNQNPEKIEFTEKDAIHSQYNGSPIKDTEIDIKGRFVGNSIFAKKNEYDTREAGDFLFDEVVKAPIKNFKRIPQNDESEQNDVNRKMTRVSDYNEFCDRKCSDSDYGDNLDILCGTDRVTYYSEAQLLCIVSCTNTDIDIDYRGPCIQGRK